MSKINEYMPFIDYNLLGSETNPKIEAIKNLLDEMDPDKSAKKS